MGNLKAEHFWKWSWQSYYRSLKAHHMTIKSLARKYAKPIQTKIHRLWMYGFFNMSELDALRRGMRLCKSHRTKESIAFIEIISAGTIHFH